MKKDIINLSLLLFGLFTVQAQVGIGTITPNSNSILEISSADRGLLMPRVALTATNLAAPMTDHVQGMTVYNTFTSATGANQVVPGFYINDGNGWIKVNDNTIAVAREPWRNMDGTAATETSTDIKYEGGKVRIGKYNTSPASPTALLEIGKNQGVTGLDVQGMKFRVSSGDDASITYNDKLTISVTGSNDALNLSSDSGIVNINAKATHPGGLYLKTSNVTRLEIQATSAGSGYGGIFIYDNAGLVTAKFAKDGKVGIGTIDPTVQLEVAGTDAVKVSAGTTLQRPSVPKFGMIRYNSDIGRGEMYVNDLDGDGILGDEGWRPI